MADVRIDMLLSDSTRSIARRRREVEDLNGQLERTRALSSQRGEGVAMQGFSQARGAIGTGAASRDFANQAQGLGGLVRVYATFAANLFAVGAAFNALKNAADTTNLLKGLEQLGTASGVNLPKVAKDLAAASGGAIALRDAMTATAQASSAGMTSQNIKRMGDVARNASQALGVDMSNALDRISRGITKLEPELLDEIGIFTRTEQASQDYARALGKSVSSLTSFEKRQAFANAVLAEGEQKFGAIALQTNPYNQLLASLKNLSQAGLELVNTVLGPIIKAMSQSPVALGAAIAAIAAVLVKQAIPALTQWRSQLTENVERTSALAAQNLEYFKNYQQEISKRASQNISETVRTQADIARTSWEGLQQQTKQSVLRNNKELRNIMKVDLDNASNDQTQRLAKVREQYERAAGATYTDPARQQAAQARLAEFNRIEPEIRRAINAQLDYNRAITAATPTSLTLQGNLLERIAINAENAERRMRILANAADNAAFSGPIAAMSAMHRSIQLLPNSIGLASRAMLYFRGTVAIAAVAVGTLTSAFGNLLGAIGVIAGVGMLLGAVFSKNGDEAAKSSKSIDDLKSAGDNLDRVFESISKKNPLQQLSADSIAASATAMADLGTVINQAIRDVDATIAARSWWDSFTNGLFSIVGKSDEQTLAKTVSKQLNKILKASTTSLDAANIRKDLTRALGLAEGASDKDIIKVFTTDVKTAGPELQRLMDKFQVSAQSGKALSDNLKELGKTFKDMTNELLPKGKVVDAIVQSTSAFSDLYKLLDGPVTVSLAGMNNLLKNTQAMSLLPPDARQSLLNVAGAVDDISNRMANNSITINTATNNLEKYSKALERTKKGEAKAKEFEGVARPQGTASASQLQANVSNAQEAIRVANLEISTDSRLLDGYRKTFATAIEGGFKANSDLLSQIFASSIQKSRIQAEQGALSKLAVTPDVINRQAELQKQQVDLEVQSQLIQNRLILANEKTQIELALLRISIDRDREERLPEGLKSQKALDNLSDELKQQKARRTGIETIEQGRGVSTASLQKLGIDPAEAQRLALIGSSAAAIRQSANIQKASIDLDASIQKINYGFTSMGKILDEEIAGIAQRINELKALPLTDTAENRAVIAELETRRITLESRKQLLGPAQQLAVARVAGPATKLTPQQMEGVYAETQRGVPGIQAAAESAKTVSNITEQTKNYQQELNKYYDNASVQLKLQADLADLASTRKSQELDYDSQLLVISRDRGIITEDDFRTRQKALQIKKVELDYEKTIVDLNRNRASQLQALAREAESRGEGEVVGEDLANRAAGIKATTDSAIDNAKRLRTESLSILDVQNEMSTTQEGLANIFKDTFAGMSDAIIDFAKTGKLNFKGLISSMIEDLIRFEMKQQSMKFLSGMGGASGLLSTIGSFFGMGGGQFGVTPIGSSGYGGQGYIGGGAAKGASFSGNSSNWAPGAFKFAKGGMFTNSIVNSPTMFKFAKGTGLMGEAGPEAIMPLKRDGQGNLGVRGGMGGNVEVVVNNYGSEKAETRQTTDSRGNRKIEVVIGDMTAGELTRSGSSSQRAVGSTFGLKPALIRR